MDYSPWGHKELDTTERLSLFYFCFFFPLLLFWSPGELFWQTFLKKEKHQKHNFEKTNKVSWESIFYWPP